MPSSFCISACIESIVAPLIMPCMPCIPCMPAIAPAFALSVPGAAVAVRVAVSVEAAGFDVHALASNATMTTPSLVLLRIEFIGLTPWWKEVSEWQHTTAPALARCGTLPVTSASAPAHVAAEA
jgi:hypothetical protein